MIEWHSGRRFIGMKGNNVNLYLGVIIKIVEGKQKFFVIFGQDVIGKLKTLKELKAKTVHP